uniref:Uncharacterized protein n=1 Tax=Oryza nivara TaxID=4536 RepID=A0A0E0J8X5_ORYNI
MVMRTAATDGVWANLKQSSETPGPIKPMDSHGVRKVAKDQRAAAPAITFFPPYRAEILA